MRDLIALVAALNEAETILGIMSHFDEVQAWRAHGAFREAAGLPVTLLTDQTFSEIDWFALATRCEAQFVSLEYPLVGDTWRLRATPYRSVGPGPLLFNYILEGKADGPV